jgi:hypothetical protein
MRSVIMSSVILDLIPARCCRDIILQTVCEMRLISKSGGPEQRTITCVSRIGVFMRCLQEAEADLQWIATIKI